MGQGASHPPSHPPKILTRSERQDELLKQYPLPVKAILRPNTNPDGSDIPWTPGSDFDFPDPKCGSLIRKLYEAMSNQEKDQITRYRHHLVWKSCGIEVDLSAHLPTKS
uniref:uncharacterized protein LOC105349807 n=1 Tax=Fragaria vesca subsp. vesca TaxID=101020 RepID=UPI0005C99021|nr:PREDICTED: uncharacterized protein LOC105349807 [Fragaria vesca subsp. vesca]XP_011458798.1 PREDICTED: uncharacterized protein LOC105349807 [Fragaria vesca subsp. vesca]